MKNVCKNLNVILMAPVPSYEMVSECVSGKWGDSLGRVGSSTEPFSSLHLLLLILLTILPYHLRYPVPL